jgi:hypothetical protein
MWLVRSAKINVFGGDAKPMAEQSTTEKPDGEMESDLPTAVGAIAEDFEALLGPLVRLPNPREVEEAVEQEVANMAAQGRPLVGKARERLHEELKLSYYFGGQPLAYRETSQGKEILAVGYKDIQRLCAGLSPEDDEAVISDFADPW